MPLVNYKYKNITISGLPGCGSTTLLNQLREALKFDKWSGFSGGEFMRIYAVEKGLFDDKKKIHHISTAYDDNFDRQVDMGMRHKLQQEKRWILESWLSGFLAQGVPHVCKVLMTCNDDSVRVDRIVNRDQVTMSEAKKHIIDRYNANLAKWSRLYKQEWYEWVVKAGLAKAADPIDFWQENLYDIVIDTYSTNKTQALELVLNAITKKKKN